MDEALASALKYYLTPFALTALTEAGAAFIFGFKKREQRSLLLINLVTNPALNLLLYCARALSGGVQSVPLLIAAEAAVVAAEALMLRSLLSEKRPYILVSLVLNAVSYFLGTYLLGLLTA